MINRKYPDVDPLRVDGNSGDSSRYKDCA